MDFTPSAPTELPTQKEDQSKNLSSLKNKKALDTLLALARTYIGMEDIESALHSLNEVMEHGSKSQKEEAQSLIDEIKGKS
ncbi:FimV/HubP family polar landmark protein [Legionella steigerwaltii]|uniref:FimV/HubP family polar landmark protein n=1 Tax=Legionella steigerwaltii TaxID=460 RepID=UPI0039ED5CC7